MSGGWSGSILRLRSLSIEMALSPVTTGARVMTSRHSLSRPHNDSCSYLGRELSKAVEPFIKQEDEGRFRCKTCQKLFKATSFVEKHIANKHPELVKQLDEVRTRFLNERSVLISGRSRISIISH